jgi:hypothetical protein
LSLGINLVVIKKLQEKKNHVILFHNFIFRKNFEFIMLIKKLYICIENIIEMSKKLKKTF